MSRHETVLLGMSGGVDSSAAALLLTRQGYRVIGASLILTDSFDPTPARRCAEALGLPENVTLLCAIPVGFPAGVEQPKDKWKPEKVHTNRW